MSNKPLLIDFTDGNRHRLFRVLKLAVLVSILNTNLTFAQDADLTEEKFQRMYDCGSYYTVINACYSRVNSEASHRLAVTAFNNRDKVIHLIFIKGKQAGILPETSSGGMKSSIEKMIKSIAGDCSNVLNLRSSLGMSCDKIIENVPKPPYDKGKKSGSLRGFVPTPIG